MGQKERHLPEPEGHAALFVVGDYMLDTSINGALDSADLANDLVAEGLRLPAQDVGTDYLDYYVGRRPCAKCYHERFNARYVAGLVQQVRGLRPPYTPLDAGSARSRTRPAFDALGIDATGVERSMTSFGRTRACSRLKSGRPRSTSTGLIASQTAGATFRSCGNSASAVSGASTRSRQRPCSARASSPSGAVARSLILTVSATDARVVAAPAAWNALSEPVLLAVRHYCRLAAINSQLERLTESAAGDLGHASKTRPWTLFRGRFLVAQMAAVRGLLLDHAHFEGPLTDPCYYLSSDRGVPLYETLAEKLHRDDRCKLLDDWFEMVEDTYACATESLFEFKNFAWEAVLEVGIIVPLSAAVFVQLLAWYE